MNGWITMAIIGLFVIATITAISFSVAKESPAKTVSCSSYSNACNAEQGCGLATCGAAKGGTCGCNKSR